MGAVVLAGACIVADHPVLGVGALVGSLACAVLQHRFENRKELHTRDGVRLDTVAAICRELARAAQRAPG